uniref:DNA-directed RNA polymerase n=1 Tax=Cajanus cajan TaxID=3821 RepID=A0A151TJM1_CAJCA|nr:DNA-directed RNA polymerase II subunit RPB1 [Cajanus cajan]
MKFRVSSNDLFRRTAIIVEANDKASKKRTLGRGLPADYWDFIPYDAQQEESYVNRRVLSPGQVFSLLKDVDQNIIEKYIPRKNLLSLDCFPVTPNCHRVTEVPYAISNGNRLSFDDRTRSCKKLVDFRGTTNELGSRVLDCLRISKFFPFAHDFSFEMQLNPDKTPTSIFADIQQRKVAENAFNSSGLRWIKDVVLGKRNDSTFRTVVVGDPDLELSEIGIPCQIAESLQVSEYVNRQNKEKLLYCCELRLLEKGQINVSRKGSSVLLYKKEDLQVGDIFYRPLTDGDKVLINRPPSIHQHSMIALTVRVLPISSVVCINPLCCSPLRGDFDGDCLHGYIPQSVSARVELNELVALDRQLINGQSGRNLLSLSQDSLTAAYLLMEDGVLLNVYQMQQLQMFCNKRLTPPAFVKAPSCNILCEWLSMTGFSVSLSDLYLSSDSYARKNMMEEITYGIQDAEKACNFKQLFLADKYGCKNNTFLAMIKAGSKGNLVKLVQHSMCLGLQNSLVRLSYRLPRHLSCTAWNSLKGLDSLQLFSGTLESVQSYIPYAVVESSFLTGLNPLECFVHSVTNRDSSFSDNADLPGTLTRRLMFFMRDLYNAYDGTVRNLYGNQLVQFSYDIEEESSCDESFQEYTIGGEPVGALSACAISEAAYSALGQPVSLLETSPLLNLKNVLECGSRKKNGDQTVSLFLSEKLGKQRHGFEYAALEVKNYLERLLFSSIVSSVMIIFTPHDRSSLEKYSPWVCHFHLDKEIVTRRKLKVHSIIDSLYQRYYSLTKESKVYFTNLKISSKKCSADSMAEEGEDNSIDKEGDDCITVTIVENSKNPIQLDSVRDSVLPFLLGTAIKGFLDIKKVDILWNNMSKATNSYHSSSGELYLRVTMSSEGNSGRFWGVLKIHCHKITQIIDWTRSHPDNINHFSSAYGIDAGWQYFLNVLASATSDTGKSILCKHLCLVANSLSASGEFVGLNAKGMAKQRKHASVSSPFVQACFSNPGGCFIKAAKSGVMDNLQGSIDSFAWGNCPSMGTSGLFDIVYSEKGHEVAKSADVYDLLEASFDKLNNKIGTHSLNYSSDKCGSEFRHKDGYALKETKQWKNVVRNFVTVNDIQKLTSASRCILNKYSIDDLLSESDRSIMLRVLHFHPRRSEKFGTGPQDIKVGRHPIFKDSRCFHIVRTDGTVEDFSYRKCILGALEIVDPKKSKIQKKKWSGDGDTHAISMHNK